ncbi:MAG TPA: hypothetical protein VI698_02740 [Nitrososphaerales archaeon]|nr:hypothetical protein [Nitrososphaerales archaeon]
MEALKIESNAKVFLDRTSYGPGSIVYVSIFDRNFNLQDDVVERLDLTQIVEGDPIVEVKIVQPTQGKFTLSAVDGSIKDSNGNSVREAVESGADTSLFEFVIQLPNDLEANSSIGVIYNDPFELSPTTREKIPTQQNIQLTETRFTDHTGRILQQINAEETVRISSVIQNGMSSTQQYSYIVQVKGSNGFTVALSWISGNVEAQRSASVAVPWTPDRAGGYIIEIFLWQNLFKPAPLLSKQETNVIVIG